nr:IclR family transcriptional regulator C-terminal domain-containing protein [Propylenella binzhouense]
MALVRGAIARSIMAFLPKRRLMPMIAGNLDELRSLGLGAGPAEIYESFRRVKRAGAAVCYGEVTPGVIGIAAPVFDGGRIPVASICVTIAGNRVGGAEIEAIAGAVRQATAALSRELAGPPDRIAEQ